MPATETWTVTSPDGTEIAVHRHPEAEGDGWPVVLVHGTACDHHVFARVARRLAKRFAVHAVDRRGRGASGDTKPYALEREAEDIQAVCETIADRAGEPIALVGHSLGGIIALEATARTDAVERLALYEPPIPGDEAYDVEAANALEQLLASRGPEAVVEAFLAEVGYTEAMIEQLRRNEAIWRITLETAGTIPREARADLAYELDPSLLARVDVPTLLLVGDRSPPMYRDAVARAKAHLADASIAVVEGASHGVLQQAPDAFVEAVVTFIKRRPT